jgi:putative membrane protein
MSPSPPAAGFWQEALALAGSVTPRVVRDVALFGLAAGLVTLAARLAERWAGVRLGLEVAPYEIAGAALGLLLVLRTNAGYDRWWEARRLWGGIVNQCRNAAISALAYGPADPAWRDRFVRWTAAFPHATRALLRGEPPPPELAALVGQDAADRALAAGHPPCHVARVMAGLLREGTERHGMDRFAFLQVDRERALLVDHLGACERILRTPLPRVYAIKVRRFILLFLLALPFALLHRVEAGWLVPVLTMLVAYPLLALDRIGTELQNPFGTGNLSHLPLDDISAGIERTLLDLARTDGTAVG